MDEGAFVGMVEHKRSLWWSVWVSVDGAFVWLIIKYMFVRMVSEEVGWTRIAFVGMVLYFSGRVLMVLLLR